MPLVITKEWRFHPSPSNARRHHIPCARLDHRVPQGRVLSRQGPFLYPIRPVCSWAYGRKRECNRPSNQNHPQHVLQPHLCDWRGEEAFASNATAKVEFHSEGNGKFRAASLPFKATGHTTRITFYSSFYHVKADDAGSLCGPVTLGSIPSGLVLIWEQKISVSLFVSARSLPSWCILWLCIQHVFVFFISVPFCRCFELLTMMTKLFVWNERT